MVSPFYTRGSLETSLVSFFEVFSPWEEVLTSLSQIALFLALWLDESAQGKFCRHWAHPSSLAKFQAEEEEKGNI